MADLTWEMNIAGNSHTVRLKHGYFSGKREIWLDGQSIVKDRQLFDSGSLHQFSIDGSSCELSIYTNGITFGYHLLLDGLPIEVTGNQRKKKSYPPKAVVLENKYWHDLAALSRLSYISIPNNRGFGRHRLIGYIRNYLVTVRFGFLQGTVAVINVLVRIAPPADANLTKSQVKAELIEKHIARKKDLLYRYLDIQHGYAIFLLPYSPKKETPDVISSKIDSVIEALSKHTHPLNENLCEGVDCRLRVGQDIRLVFTNSFPQYLCSNCIDNIPILTEKYKEEFQKAPSGLVKGILAGLIAAVLGGIAWAAVAVVLDTVAAAIGLLIFVLVLKAMQKSGTKLTTASLLVAGAIGIMGIIFGVYLSIVISIMRYHPDHLPIEIFKAAWQYLWEEKSLTRIWMVFGAIGIFPYMWLLWRRRKQEIAQLEKPEVEIVKDFSVLCFERTHKSLDRKNSGPTRNPE